MKKPPILTVTLFGGLVILGLLYWWFFITTPPSFDGTWKGRNEATLNPDECEGGEIILTIEGNSITGETITDLGFNIPLAGKVDEDGSFRVQLADPPYDIVTFTGKIKRTGGSGNWTTKEDCGGKFKIKRYE